MIFIKCITCVDLVTSISVDEIFKVYYILNSYINIHDICVHIYFIILNQMTMRMTRTKRDDYGDDDKADNFFTSQLSRRLYTHLPNKYKILIVIVVADGSLSGEKNN